MCPYNRIATFPRDPSLNSIHYWQKLTTHGLAGYVSSESIRGTRMYLYAWFSNFERYFFQFLKKYVKKFVSYFFGCVYRKRYICSGAKVSVLLGPLPFSSLFRFVEYYLAFYLLCLRPRYRSVSPLLFDPDPSGPYPNVCPYLSKRRAFA